MRQKKILSFIIVGLCLVLFYSLHLMTSNIDKDRMMTSNENEDKKMLIRFKDNIVELKNQIQENENKISEIKNIIENIQVSGNNNNGKDGNDKNSHYRGKDSKILKELIGDKDRLEDHNDEGMLKCPVNSVGTNNNAEIQMSKMVDKLPFSNPDGGVWKQGYDIKYPEPNTRSRKLKVFVIPHSHCDPGWIKTFKRYFQDQVSHILNLAVDKLIEYPTMRFVYAEMSYFNLWWKTLSTTKKETIKKLLDEKRLEILTGGWVMSDEANSHYFAMLDQLIEGNQWLHNELGYKAKSGWSIDPFGHSPMMAYLLKRSGFENMLIQRTHYAIKKELSLHKNLEFYWRQNWDASGNSDMLCHMMPFYSYDVPHTCGPDPKICCQFDFRRMNGNRYSCPWRINPVAIRADNVEERAQTLLDQYRKKGALYNNDIVLVPLGDDFRYEVSEEWDAQHNNYIKLFDYMNKRQDWNVEAKFATLSEYFDELRIRKGTPDDNTHYPTLSGDFFVYADRDEHYWSGYFTSRPFYKRLDRELEYHQRTAEMIFSIALATSRAHQSNVLESSDLMSAVVLARRTLGLFQHHDGITGTSKTFVVDDYGSMMLEGITTLKRVIRLASQYVLLKDKVKFNREKDLLFDVDETRSHHSEMAVPTLVDLLGSQRKVYFYNSLGQARRSLVTLVVNVVDVEVLSEGFVVVESQIDPVWAGENFYDISDSQFKLSFVADVPAMGFVSFTIRKTSSASNPHNCISTIQLLNTPSKPTKVTPFKITLETEGFLENEDVKVLISDFSGLTKSIEMKNGGEKVDMEIEFVKYGTTRERDRSGAYLFIPGGEARPHSLPNPNLRITKGSLSSEASTNLHLVTHTIRCASTKSGVSSLGLDVLNVVDIRDTSNTELAMRIKTGVSNIDRFFYTDMNGFQVIKRKYQSKLPIQGNFYPVSSLAYIQDAQHRFTLLTGQSLGVASLKTGWLEVMQDRRLDQDDNRGMEQDVRDNRPTPNHFRLLLEAFTNPVTHDNKHDFMGFQSFKSHFSSLDLLYPLHSLPLSLSVTSDDFENSRSALNKDLPCDLHVVNLRSLGDVGGEDDGAKFTATPSQKTALIVLKTAFDCGLEGISKGVLQCSHHPAQVSSLFSDLEVVNISKTPLNLLEDNQDNTIYVEEGQLTGTKEHTLSEVPVMEIAAFVLKFKKLWN